MARIGIFGGTFDPLHTGHVIVALEVLERVPLDRLLLVPARRSPLKDDGPGLPGAVRASLLRRVLEPCGPFFVDERELRRGRPSFTVDTVEELGAEHPGDELCFLLGADSLDQLHLWHEIGRLARLCTFLVARRPGAPEDLPPAAAAVPELRATWVETTPIGISATAVRERVARRLPVEGYVPAPVAAEIRRSGAYGALPGP